MIATPSQQPNHQPQQQQMPVRSKEGPLAHVIDALRFDNHQLLLEALRRDPRFENNNNNNDNDFQQRHTATTTATVSVQKRQHDQEQLLIFGSVDLRRVILRHVADSRQSHSDQQNQSRKMGASTGNRKNNVAIMEEEEFIIKQLNNDLRLLPTETDSGAADAASGAEITMATQFIIGTQILSPSGNGSAISPYESSIASVTPSPSSSPSSTTISYILRGAGFDLPSLSAAALHRRNTLLQAQKQQIQHSNYRQANTSVTRLFRFLFVPRITEIERAFLKEMGVVEDDNYKVKATAGKGGSGRGEIISITSFESLPIDLIPLDNDVLSLELTGGRVGYGSISTTNAGGGGGSGSTSSSDVNQGGGIRDNTSILGEREGFHYSTGPAACLRHSSVEGCEADVADIVARSLIKLQLLNRGISENEELGSPSLRGAIPRLQGLGPLASAVIERMMTLRLDEERREAEMNELEGEASDEVIADDGVGDGDVGGRRLYHANKEITSATTEEGVEITTINNSTNEGVSFSSTATSSMQPSIQALLVIDRRIDLVTPMLTPLTYEGLIDDILQIQVGGYVSIKKSIVEPDSEKQGNSSSNAHHDLHQTVLLPLNDSDPLYREVRDKHVETFGTFLQNQAKALKESHSQFTNRETARDLTEIHQFVKQIPVFTRNLLSLTNHIHIAELVKSAAEASSFRHRWQAERSMLESEPCYEILEDLIASGSEPPYRWLRLFCLQSLTSNGIKAARYDTLRRDVIQTYGYEYLMVLNDLERAGFLRKKETFVLDSMATPYSILRKALNLINPDVDPSNPQDASYVSSGYAPMTVRWIEAAMRGYVGLDEALRELPVGSGIGGGGRLVDVVQRWPPESLAEASKNKGDRPSLGTFAKQWLERKSIRRGDNMITEGPSTTEKPVLLVYFVGGVTFMELAAMRYLSRSPSFPYHIVCCTTEVVNGGTLLKSLSC